MITSNGSSAPNGQGEPGRVLVVDDNVAHLQTLEMLLDSTGHACRFFEDGPSAIEAAKQDEYDLLLTDVRMAPLDGVETARAVKHIQPQMAVIMMTGFDKEDTPLEALRLGAADYIDKPITDANRFLRTLDQQIELVHSEKQLRTIKERLETVIRNVDTGVVVLDAESIVADINAAALGLIAPGESSALGKPFREVCRLTELHQLAPRDGTISTTLQLRGEAGQRVVQVDASRLDAVAGRAGGLVLLLKDLTALADRQKAEGWRQMSRAITHGMKTPLGTLRLRLERLKSRPADESTQAEVGMLLGVVGELHQRLSDLVDFVKLDVSPAPTDVNSVVERAIQRFEPHRKATTTIEFVPGVLAGPIRIAAGAMSLAIENLLANSQEATNDPVHIRASTLWNDASRAATVTVEDNGPGVPDEVRDDLFSRPLNSTKPGGSGLGAALVKYIVDQHKGTLDWQSPATSGRGLRVTLTLPTRD